MSIATHARRLKRLERPYAPREETLADLLAPLQRERDAALSLVVFARALAGTDRTPPAATPPTSEARPRVTRPPRSKGRVWTKDIRPGPNDWLTWEEAMSVPWIDGGAASES